MGYEEPGNGNTGSAVDVEDIAGTAKDYEEAANETEKNYEEFEVGEEVDYEESENEVQEDYEESELLNNGTVDATWLNRPVSVEAWLDRPANNYEESELLNIGVELDSKESEGVGVGCEEPEVKEEANNEDVEADYEESGSEDVGNVADIKSVKDVKGVADVRKDCEELKMKKFCTRGEVRVHCQKMSPSWKARSKDLLVLLEDRLASEMKSSRCSFNLKKEDRRRVMSLVGETKQEVVLIILTTSTSPERRRGTIVLVREFRREV